jgi:hypothetical protein
LQPSIPTLFIVTLEACSSKKLPIKRTDNSEPLNIVVNPDIEKNPAIMDIPIPTINRKNKNISNISCFLFARFFLT